MANQPAIMFYVGDWLKDPAVRAVSLAARGMWIDMLCLMHNSARRGYLQHATGKPVSLEQIARMTGCSPDEASRLLQELSDSGVCSVDEHGTVYCRRMVRESRISQVRSEAGRKGVCSSNHPSKLEANEKQSRKQKPPPSSSVSFSTSSSFAREGPGVPAPAAPRPGENCLEGEKSIATEKPDATEKPPSVVAAGVSAAESGHESSGDADPPENACNAIRDPEEPPDWCDADEWRTACRLADLIEAADTGAEVVGRGEVARAWHIAMLLQDAGKGNVLRTLRVDCIAAIEKLSEGRWRDGPRPSEIMRAMQNYPDGVYPASAGTNGGKRASRVEEAFRLLATEDRKVAPEFRGKRRSNAGFQPIGDTMGKISRKP